MDIREDTIQSVGLHLTSQECVIGYARCTISTRKILMVDKLIERTINESTGEVTTHTYTRDVDTPRRKPRDKDFWRSRPGAMKELLRRKLRPSELNVLLWMASDCEWQNRVEIKRQELERELGLSRKQVYNALEGLRKQGLIIFNDTRSVCWIEPTICWRGYSEKLSAARAEYMQKLAAGE